MKASSKSFQKHFNLSLVARSIWESEGISRVEISNDIKLDKASVSNIVNQLLKNRLVTETNVGSSNPKGGRKPVDLEISYSYGYVLGLGIQPDKYKIAILSLKGEVLYKAHFNVAEDLELFDIIDLAIKKVKSEFKLHKKILGCTVGLAGFIDGSTGIVKNSETFKIFNVNIGKMLYDKYNIPFLIENDANCGAWGEIFHDNDKDGNFLFLLGELNKSNTAFNYKGGLAIGIGVVVDNKVYYGFNHASGEFKSVFWENGHDYQFGSEEAIKSVNRLPGVLTDEVLEELLLNLSTILSVLNPQRVVVGGCIGRYTDRINALIKSKFSENQIAEKHSKCCFVESNNGVYDVAIGAASMFIEKLFRVPELSEADCMCNISWENLFQTALLKK